MYNTLQPEPGLEVDLLIIDNAKSGNSGPSPLDHQTNEYPRDDEL
jgi:hypothetical protein